MPPCRTGSISIPWPETRPTAGTGCKSRNRGSTQKPAPAGTPRSKQARIIGAFWDRASPNPSSTGDGGAGSNHNSSPFQPPRLFLSTDTLCLKKEQRELAQNNKGLKRTGVSEGNAKKLAHSRAVSRVFFGARADEPGQSLKARDVARAHSSLPSTMFSARSSSSNR